MLIANSVEAEEPTPKAKLLRKPVINVIESSASRDAVKLEQQGHRVWQPAIADITDWKQLSKPLRNTRFSKFVIDVKTGKIYFFDVNVFTLHIDFVMDYLLKQARTPENVKAYNQNYSTEKPQFILGYLTHYPKQKAWTFSFWEGDKITKKMVLSTADALKKAFKVAPLKFRPDSPYQEHLAKQLKSKKVPVIYNADLYQAMPYQAFNSGEAIGKLNIVEASNKIESLQFSQHEVVILQQSYPDISPVSGIVTTQFSTPLSHVNLRANAWGIPNASLKTAVKDYAHLNGKWVKLVVTEKQLTLVEATDKEVQTKQKLASQQKKVEMPDANLSSTELAMLKDISLSDVRTYGAKTAHLGEMVQAELPVPNGFGIPFHYYQEHMQTHGLDQLVMAILNDARFNDLGWRKQQLRQLQKKINQAPINKASLSAILQQWQARLGGASVFVRSSTNAEDLPNFNGAGLYDTVPNVQSELALEAAVKKVWASLWNLRAVNERAYFGIPQTKVYAAVLIQKGLNASASGVLLTTDIWAHERNVFTINAKRGLGIRVVNGQKIAEQVLYDVNNHGTRIISRSDENSMLVFDADGGIKEVSVPKGVAIINEQSAKNLGSLALKVADLFPQYTVLDIEWLFVKDKNGQDQAWLVQARPYIDK